MNRRSLLAMAASMTAIILILIAVVAPRVSNIGTPPAPTTVTAPLQATPMTNVQPQLGSASYTISIDKAGALAVAGAPGATLSGTPILVTYQGIVAYEVPLSTGLAYVDVTNGTLLAAPGVANTTPSNGTTTDQGGEGQGDNDD